MKRRGSPPSPASEDTHLLQGDSQSISQTEPAFQTTLPLDLTELEKNNSSDISSLPVRSADRFQIQECVGKGAMGEVYRAFDPLLNRTIALKFLLQDSGVFSKRFLREAQIQARINHPFICKVYEIGILQDKPYIAMDFIDGRPFTEVASQMSLDEKMKMIQQVAEALHEAHKMGLIHRDIKPGNILVQRTADDEWKAYVTDFGIAHEQGNPGLTKDGMFIGTPPYMAPEQTRADPQLISPKTDIYALGCTLYELIAGVRPFDGKNTAEIVMKILNEDAVSLHQRVPSIPNDLETIVSKCMEKDPAHRYDSARALAEDLRRYLDGEPILARPSNWLYRLIKKAKKNKAAAVLITSSLVVCLIALLFGAYTWWLSGARSRIAHQFGQQVTEIEGFMRYAYALPLHDIRSDIRVVRDRMKVIEQQMKDSGWLAAASGHYALGRGHLVLQDYEKAQQHLEIAWNSGYHEPQVAYALGLVMGALYQRGLARIQSISSKELQEALKKEIEKKYKVKALEYLRGSKGVQLEAPAYLEALIAYYDEKYSEALQKIDMAFKQAPWFYEARKLQGAVLAAMGNQKKAEGKYSEASSLMQRAVEAYASAGKTARSDSGLFAEQCGLWVWQMEIAIAQGHLPQKEFSESVRSCDIALTANPENPIAYARQSAAYMRWGQFQATQGANPKQTLEQAIQVGDSAVKFAPAEVDGYVNRGTAYFMKAYLYEIRHGVDPEPTLQQSIRNYQKAASLGAGYAAYSNLGNAYAVLAEYGSAGGRNPLESFQMAVDSYQKALQLYPQLFIIHQNLASTFSRKARYEFDHGLDCAESVESSIKHYQKALQSNPNDSTVHSNLGTVQQLKAEWQKVHGMNPMEMYSAAHNSFEKSIQLNPSNVYAFNNACWLSLSQAKYEFLVRKNPEQTVHRLMESCQKAVELNPNFALAYNNLAAGYRLMAEMKMESGNNPQKEIRKAKELLEQSIKLNPKLFETYFLRGEVETTAARWSIKNHQSPESAFKSAIYWLTESLKYNADHDHTYIALAEAYRDHAKWQLNKGDSAAKIENGIKMAQQAYSLNRFAAEALVIQAELQMLLAQTRAAEEKQSLFNLARQNLQKAFQQNPFLKIRYDSLIKPGITHKLLFHQLHSSVLGAAFF